MNPAQELGFKEPAETSAPQRFGTPLSFGQQRLWLLDRLNPGTAAYNVRMVLRLSGRLDVAALRASIDAIVARHEALRTTFETVDEEPVAIVAESCEVPLPAVDLGPLTPDESERETRRIIRDEASRPFDLRNGPLLRTTLIRTGEERHILLVVMHHIVGDAASNRIFRRELVETYRARRAGTQPSLPDLPVQYADYAAWERERLAGDALGPHLDYWRSRLAGAPARIDLPANAVSEGAQRIAAGSASVVLPETVREGLRRAGTSHNASLFMTLLGAFAVLLYRYTGQRDLVIGSPISQRNRAELEGLIGFFVNTLALRTDLNGERTFDDVLQAVRSTVLEAYDHADVPFEQLVEVLRPERRANAIPLINVMFVLHRRDAEELSAGELSLETIGIETATTNFDLTLNVVDAPDGLRCTLQYDTALFDAAFCEQMLAHFGRLVRELVAHPDEPVASLPMLGDEERRRLLIDWNDTQRPYPAAATLAELFEAQVARTPDAIAVAAGEGRISYAELDRRANAVARMLADQPASSVVAVACERSIDMVVGVLGTLKAGCAYLPLAPGEPVDRLAYMLNDARVSVLLTQSRFAARFAGLGAQVRPIDDAAANAPAAAGDGNPRDGRDSQFSQRGADAPAYVMYTSGSTGKPKGVLIPHRAVTRLVCNADYVQIGPADVVAQVSSFAFDAVTFELWGALLNGARLEIVPRDITLSPREFAQTLAERQISVMLLTTVLFRQMSREQPAALGRLRCLLTGGEALDGDSANAVLEAGAPQIFRNAYGPTEVATIACSYEIRDLQTGPVPVGKPISNTQAYVLDDDMQLLPAGARGQLYLGGVGLALGYLGDPALTASRFVPDPFSSETGARLYASGDLVRYRPDGNLEFLGRRDRQVKIRGFRVETGEIEAALRRHPAVRDAQVVVREDAAGEKRLLAYVAVAPSPSWDTAAWRRFLADRLPQYMLPSSVVELPALPLTSSGKIDTAALPLPAAPQSAQTSVQLNNPLHYQLAALWEKHLGVGPIGIDHSFFDLGGHSLLAARLIGDVERVFGKRIPLATLFDVPTIAHMSDVLVGDVGPASSAMVALQTGGSRPPFFFLHGDITGGGYYAREFARYLGSDQPLYVLAPHGVDGRALPHSVEAMAADYVAAIKEVQPQGRYLLGGHCSGGLVAFEMARKLTAQGDVVENLVLIDASGKNGRLTRFADGVDTVAKALGLSIARRSMVRQGIGRYAWSVRRLRRRARLGIPAVFGRVADELVRRVHEPSARATLYGAWVRMSATYVPRRYNGRISLLTPSADGGSRKESVAGWRAVGASVTEYPVPGSHLTCITQYVADTAARVSQCVQEPQRTSSR